MRIRGLNNKKTFIRGAPTCFRLIIFAKGIDHFISVLEVRLMEVQLMVHIEHSIMGTTRI